MSESGLQAAQKKMRQAGVNEAAVKVFTHYYHQLEAGTTGLIPEETISPLTQVQSLQEAEVSPAAEREALAKTVIIKLNGGLGTSMGMDRAKTLLPVRNGYTFLDIIVRQVLSARERYGVRLPLIFMDSFRTQADTLTALAKYPQLVVDDLPLDFVQNQEPKLRADDLSPVSYPQDPSLEWCPPGHGDIYTALYGSGLLDKLIDAGFRYAATANADNLGAAPVLRWPAGLPLVVPPTPLRCASVLWLMLRVDTWQCVTVMGASSCVTPPRLLAIRCTISLISTVTLTSTPTTCGLTWWLCVKCYVSATAYWGCR